MKILITEEQLNVFKKNIKLQESVKVTDVDDGFIGYPGQGTHAAEGWYNRNAWDIKSEIGSKVYSIIDGIVTKVSKRGGKIIVSNGKVIYGDGVTIRAKNGLMVYYAHINTNVSQGDEVFASDVIGVVMAPDGMPPHVHIALSKGNIKDFADVTGTNAFKTKKI